MYNPSSFQNDDPILLAEVARRFPFATLVTPGVAGLEISHLPLLLEERQGAWVLVGHMARANPHWRALSDRSSVAIFQGPQAYITPLWYRENDVPTWNYIVLHCEGEARLLETATDTVQALEKLVQALEGVQGWRFQVPDDLSAPGLLQKAIVAFELPVRARNGKWKLSQNRSAADIQGVLAGLRARPDEQSQGVAEWMQRMVAASV